MGLWDKLTGEFIDIIEWTDDSNDTLVWRFERFQNEIKNGAKLTVRQQQVAVFVNEGKVADVFTSGMYELKTENLPVLSTLKGWGYGFNSPFKAEVYFVNTRVFTDNKWGTKSPVHLRDPDFGLINLRAFGNYSIRVEEPAKLIQEIVGTDGHFTLDEIHSQLKTMVVSRFTDAVAESKIPVLDLAANYDELSDLMKQRMSGDFSLYGLSLHKFLVENISLPEVVQEAINKRSAMGAVGDLQKYTQFQAAEAMEAAAKNPGGDAGAGIGMGMGFAMANQMASAMNPMGNSQPGAAAPPPIPPQIQYFVAVNGQQTGPFGLADIQQKVATKEIDRNTLVWTEGMANWASAGDVDPLKSLFGSMPPPIPGA